jgi:hypothetical protein
MKKAWDGSLLVEDNLERNNVTRPSWSALYQSRPRPW